MNNHKENDCYKNKRAEKELANNVIEYVVYKKILIAKA